MTADAPRVHRIIAAGEPEFILAHGPQDGPQLLILQPLFEEMNRCRALVSALCRSLAGRGIGCWLPDLPGTGESPRALENVGWDDWRDAVQSAAALIRAETNRVPLIVAIRGGVLLDAMVATRRWRLSPTTGRSLLSDLRRSALASGGDPSAPAGYRLGAGLDEALQSADIIADGEARTLRLLSDDRPADRHIEAPPLWRRPEPTPDKAFADLLSEDIHAWAVS